MDALLRADAASTLGHRRSFLRLFSLRYCLGGAPTTAPNPRLPGPLDTRRIGFVPRTSGAR